MAAKFDRIADDIRRKITSGDVPPGGRLPAETDLVEEYSVSLATVRRAVEVLEAEGLVEKHHGTGTFVREKPQRVLRSNERYQWEKDRALLPESERGETGASEYDTGLPVADLSFTARYEHALADADLALAFGIPVGTPLLQRIFRTRPGRSKSSLGVGRSFLVLSLVEKNPMLLDAKNEPWPGGTHHQLSTVGIEIDRIIDRVGARPASASEADELGIRPGSPVLSIVKTSIDTGGRVVEVAEFIRPGDRVELSFSTTLRRWPSE
jgi:GntR family transcriptional regulator